MRWSRRRWISAFAIPAPSVTTAVPGVSPANTSASPCARRPARTGTAWINVPVPTGRAVTTTVSPWNSCTAASRTASVGGPGGPSSSAAAVISALSAPSALGTDAITSAVRDVESSAGATRATRASNARPG